MIDLEIVFVATSMQTVEVCVGPSCKKSPSLKMLKRTC